MSDRTVWANCACSSCQKERAKAKQRTPGQEWSLDDLIARLDDAEDGMKAPAPGVMGQAADTIKVQAEENERLRDWIRNVSGLGDEEIDEYVLKAEGPA